jgi:hypothetical protein
MRITSTLAALSVVSLGLLAACGGGGGGGADTDSGMKQPLNASRLSRVKDRYLISNAEATEWFQQKVSWGPTYTGSPAMLAYMKFIEDKAIEYGAVNVIRHRFPYDRWYTTEYPDKSGWSLVSDGTPVEVASYATQSGTTGPGGVSAPMVLYDMTLPAAQRPPLSALVGKIVVVKQAPFIGSGIGGGYTDYEFRTDGDTFLPQGTFVDPTYEASYRNRHQFGAMGTVINQLFRQAVPGPVGHVVVLDMPPGAAAGGRQHGTPNRYEVPGLLLDRKAGAKVIEDAREGKTATLRLDAKVETNAQAYSLMVTLPGKDFGTPKDTAILMATHTDGPSVIQDSGAMGILAVLKYYSQLPQAQRTRSIFAVFDVRHFVPGAERSYPFDYVADNHDTLSKWVVGGVAMEHLGGRQFADVGDEFKPTGRAMTTYVNVHCNDVSIQHAIEAVSDNRVPRAQVNAEECVGVNGKQQNNWYGRNFAAHLEELGNHPVWHVTGDWPSTGYQMVMSMERFSVDVFRAQVGTAVQLVGTLMRTKDLLPMSPSWPLLTEAITVTPDASFIDPATAAAARDEMLALDRRMFERASTGDYSQAPAHLAQLRSLAVSKVAAGTRLNTITGLIAELEAKVAVATAKK